MTVETKVKASVQIEGKVMKGIKNLIKNVKKNKSVDILNFVKFDVKDNQLQATVTYSDGFGHDFKVTESYNVEVVEKGSFLVYVDFLKRFEGIKNKDVYTFSGDNDHIEVNKNGSKHSYISLDPVEYPKVIEGKLNYVATVDYNEILNLNTALTSISSSDARPVLKNVLIRNNKIASTDSHRLFMTNSQIENEEDIMITSAGIKKLKDMFDKKDKNINVSMNDHYIKFENENVEVMIKLHDGNYPQLDRLIPDRANTEIIVDDVEGFKQMIEDAKTISQGSRNNVIKLEVNENTLHVTANAPEVGQYENSTKLNHAEGEDLKLAMSGQYLFEGIKQVNEDQIKIKFNSPTKPFIVTPLENDNVLSLILPVRTY